MRSTIVTRPARPGDLDGIMRVERESFGDEVGEEGMASPEMMASRIRLCNGERPGWFRVALVGGRIEGYFVLQPTRLSPDHCTGWSQATDEGRLAATFDPRGAYVYGVSLGTAHGAPRGTIHALVAAIHRLRIESRKPILYACARMPGFVDAHARTGIAAEEYWCKRRRGLPADAFLRHFETVLGLRPSRLLVNGYPPDSLSGGHGVLCMSGDPEEDLARTLERLQGLQVNVRNESEA